nr:hypothetical protein BaRGS_029129 [Batillaria attramentaria]
MELYVMNLSVMIIADDEGQRFLRIRTEKSAPLYASLENVLQPGVYYYDIVGPKLTINWETPAGELQGAQLTLKKRSQPNPDSYSLIYGTLSDPSQHQFPTLETLPHAHPPPPVVTTGTRTLDLNIRPSPCNSPANVSLTFAKNPAIHAPELDFAHFVPVSDVDMDYLLNNQPLTDLGFRDTFEQTMSRRDTTFPKLQGEPSHRVGSPSLGLNKPQFAATSHVLQKEGVRNEGACALPQGKLSFSNLGAQEPKEHDESYVDVGGVSSSNSSNGPCGGDYIPHNHPMLIRFCNNPSTASTPSPSTPSPGFPSATTSSCATTTTASGRQRLGAQMFGSVSPDSNSEFPEDSSVFSDSFQGAERDNSGAGSDYMPHSFIQKQWHSVAFVPSGSAPHQYFVLDHQGGSPQVGLRDTAPATADDGGYMDMSGSGRDAPMRSLQLDNGNLSPPVARTSLPAFLRLDSLPVDCTPSLDSDAEMELSLDSDRAAPHRELSDSELQQVAGWCPTVTERTIESTMSRHVNEDGNFIVWRYSTGGKYVISVRSRSLAALVAHYQSNSMSEPTKTFRTPEGEVRRSGSSRLSHVRLRKPLTVRYGQESSRTKH